MPIEIATRELDGKLLLATHLTARGYNVVLGGRSEVERDILKTNGNIIILKSISNRSIEFYKELKKKGHKLYLLHAEGNVYYKKIKHDILSAFPEDCISYVDKILVNGKEIKDNIVKYISNVDVNRIFTTGDPRFDLLLPKYRAFFKRELDQIKEKYNDYILVNTNFGYANPYMGKKTLDHYISNHEDFTESFKKSLFAKKKYSHQILREFIEAIKKIAISADGLNIVVRPHPSERKDIYSEEFSKIDNVFVNNNGSVVKWILGSTIVVQHDCTTGVEAVIANKLSVSYTPKKDEDIVAWLPIYLSKEISNLSELVSFVESILSKDSSELYLLNDQQKEVLSMYFGDTDGSSSGNIIDIIDEERIDDSCSALERLNHLISRSYSRYKEYLIYYRRNANDWNKFPELSLSDIYFKMDTIANIEGINISLKIRKLSKRLVDILGK